MKRLSLFVIALLLILVGCNQDKSNESQITESNVPDTHIKINKEYDKEGNIISYDSTYSSYYSGTKDNILMRDSILDQFKKQLYQKYSFSNQPYFDKLFFQDSLLKYDFYKKDFFSNRFRDNMKRMDSLFLQMDSVKNDFFRYQPNKDNNQSNATK